MFSLFVFRLSDLALWLVVIAALLSAPQTGHTVWEWLKDSAVTEFKASDWALLDATAKQVLDKEPNGVQVNWSNPETGNRGSIIAMTTFTYDGKRCRKAAMRNIAYNGLEGITSYSLCQQPDGTWQFVAESQLQQAAAEKPSN